MPLKQPQYKNSPVTGSHSVMCGCCLQRQSAMILNPIDKRQKARSHITRVSISDDPKGSNYPPTPEERLTTAAQRLRRGLQYHRYSTGMMPSLFQQSICGTVRSAIINTYEGGSGGERRSNASTPAQLGNVRTSLFPTVSTQPWTR